MIWDTDRMDNSVLTVDYDQFCLRGTAEWLMQKTITRLVLAITSKETLETVERWQFDIITEDENGTGESSGSGKLCPL